MLEGCQGKPRTPTIIEKICPQYARKCVVDEMYEHMMEIAAVQKARKS